MHLDGCNSDKWPTFERLGMVDVIHRKEGEEALKKIWTELQKRIHKFSVKNMTGRNVAAG